MEVQPRKIWDEDSPQQTLGQVMGECGKAGHFGSTMAADGKSFALTAPGDPPAPGILSIHGRLVDDDVIAVKAELWRGEGELRVPPAFLVLSARLGEKTRLFSPPEGAGPEGSVWAELRVKATPLSMVRSSALLAELTTLAEIAKILQAGRPEPPTDSALVALYAGTDGVLAPVHPWPAGVPAGGDELLAFGRRVLGFLSAGLSVAIASAFAVQLEAALAFLALAARECGRTVGRLTLPSVNARGLIELLRKAPGTVAAPVTNISLGSNPYELGSEMQSLLVSATEANTPFVAFGRHPDLQAAFHGGQGGESDPLRPVLVHPPEIPFESLARFAVITAARPLGGLSAAGLNEVAAAVLAAVEGLPAAGRIRMLPVVARRCTGAWIAGRKMTPAAAAEFAAETAAQTETLAGLSPKPAAGRSPQVQERWTRRLTDPALLDYFRERLLAQDTALRRLADRLANEVLTRPGHQPVRYCALGTPATGKSESAALLARWLDVPLVNIDAASMSDLHTATGQLLGSGRGIVGSHQAGRLEQAAKHHAGVVLEVSDIDHAVPSVQACLADLFLQVLDTGEAQTSIGPRVSCANMVIAFTMNLPGGLDERIRQPLGFGPTPNRREVTQGVAAEMKSMLSGAFLSRIGTPIVFDPLDGPALLEIVGRAVQGAVRSAVERLGFGAATVAVAPGAAEAVLASFESKLVSFGARALLEHARDLTARAVLAWARSNPAGDSVNLTVAAAGGDLTVQTD